MDALAIKLDATGATVWAKNFGGSGAYVYGQSLAIDGAGNVYLSGSFEGASLTTPALIKIGTRDAFVIKLDAIGVAAWAREYGGLNPGGYAAIDATALDATGQTYVAGTFNGATITLGSVTLTRIGDYDVLVAKLDMDGNVIWARNFGGVGAYAYGQSVAVDGAGNVFLGGVFEDASLTTPALARIGRGDAFVIKLDATGATIWAKNFGGSGAFVYAQSVATDGVGNVYLGGYFGSANLTAPALTKIGYTDTFVVKLDMTGATTWARNFGGIGASTFGQSFAPDSAGSIYLSGAFGGADLTTPALTRIGSQDAFVVKLDATGTATWAQNFGGNGASAAFHGLAVDGDGNAYVGGWFGNADLTTPALVRIGSYDAFAVKVDAAGTIAWARTFGGSGATAVARSIALDGAGSVYLGGYFDNASLATPAMARIGAQDAFAIKLNGGGTTTWSRNLAVAAQRQPVSRSPRTAQECLSGRHFSCRQPHGAAAVPDRYLGRVHHQSVDSRGADNRRHCTCERLDGWRHQHHHFGYDSDRREFGDHWRRGCHRNHRSG
ncbi:MAG: SBBP repeat-containing protein [Betaproteobacteria bacterium]|nr:SBBP repeat-containing protein [Betaproteobacteria bacterium]